VSQIEISVKFIDQKDFVVNKYDILNIKMVRQILRNKSRHLRQFTTIVGNYWQVRMPCFKTLHKNNPTLYNSVMYGGLYTAAEISQQAFYKYKASMASAAVSTSATPVLDIASIGRYAMMGTAMMGPLFSKWYAWIDRAFPSKAKKVVFKKTLIDQFLFTPVCVAVFYIGMAVMEGCTGAKIFEELLEKGPKTFAMDCCFWIPCTAANFLLIPSWARVTFVAVASFVWVNVLCWIKSWPRESSGSATATTMPDTSSPVKAVSKPETSSSTKAEVSASNSLSIIN